MGLDAHYSALLTRAGGSLEALVADAERLRAFTAVHNFGAEFEVMISAVKERPEALIFNLALREFHYALYASASGSYRHAHISLRLFFELFSAGVFFSAYEIKLRAWLSAIQDNDVSWSVINHQDTGIFSPQFLTVFHPGLAPSGKQYSVLATKAYRECSEFVHGNIQTQDLGISPLNYNAALLEAWIARAEAVKLCLTFGFAGRYLCLIDREALTKVEAIILDSLGHLGAIRAVFA